MVGQATGKLFVYKFTSETAQLLFMYVILRIIKLNVRSNSVQFVEKLLINIRTISL